jgi:hypothetical protein
VDTALGGAGLNGTPRDQITQILGEITSRNSLPEQAGAVDLDQQLAMHGLVNAEGHSEVGVV